jgi:HAE1 family hydrophobic/amphiphilic exporter-1
MKFLRYILNHPTSIIISVMLIVFIGINSFLHIPIEIRPTQSGGFQTEEEQQIQIQAYWQGQPSEIVQKTLTYALEEQCMQLDDIGTITSSTTDEQAYIRLSFPREVNEKYVYITLKENISQLRKTENFPQEAIITVKPVFQNDEEQKQNESSFFEFQINGPQELNALRKYTEENILPLIKTVDGTGECNVYGGSNGYLKINIDPEQLDKYKITLPYVQRKIRSQFHYLGIGRVEDKNKQYYIFFDNRPKSVMELANCKIFQGLTLKNIATISYEYEKPTTISRRNFMPLITIKIYKIPGVNSLEFAKKIKGKIAEITSCLPDNMDLVITVDQSEELRNELSSMGIMSTIILSVVFIILLVLFRKIFPSFIILFLILLTFCCSAIFLYFSGYTINIMTLAGIALVFGMLVDNSVVVVENIQHYVSLGKRPYIAALRGTLEIYQPLLASSATTILVFFSLLLLDDRLGNYYQSMAFVLGFTLLTSLILAVVLIPALYINFPNRFKPSQKTLTAKDRNIYGRFLATLLKFPGFTAFFTIFLLAGFSVWFFIKIEDGGRYYYSPEKLKTNVHISAPKGVTLETLDDMANSFEAIVAENIDEAETRTNIDQRNGIASISIEYSNKYKNSTKPYMVEAKLIGQAVDYAGVGISISGMFPKPYYNGGYRIYTNYNSRLKITGPDYDKLWQISEYILEMARKDRRVGETIITPSVRNFWSLQSGEHNYRYGVNPNKVWEKGHTLSSVFYSLYSLFPNAYMNDEIYIDNTKYDLKMELKSDLTELDHVLKSSLTYPGKQSLYFQDIMEKLPEKHIQWIDKKNQQYQFTIAWDYRGAYQQQERHLKNLMESIDIPAGYELEKRDWGFLSRKEKKELNKLLVIAAVGVFMIMAALYNSLWQPFVIFLSVPFSLLGVFIMYLLFDKSFNSDAYIGIILLLGIVVNDAIVLVERINQLKTKNKDLKKVLIRAGKERIRPI